MFTIRVTKIIFLLTNIRCLLRYLSIRVVPAIEHRPVLTQDLCTVVDIGANRGQFALATQLFTGANIISFEPLPIPAAACRKALSHAHNFTLFESAVAPESGLREINISKSDDSSSLLVIGEKQVEIFPGTEKRSSQTINAGPLSDFISASMIKSPSMLKVDVQGFELQTLLGCESLLHLFDKIYCECSFIELYKGQSLAHEVISFLAEKGFKFVGIYNTSYTDKGIAIQADFLFERIEC